MATSRTESDESRTDGTRRAAKAKMEVRCLVVPNCTDGADLAARHTYLNSIGIPESSIVNLEYFDYARSKYLALGLPDTMPPKGT